LELTREELEIEKVIFNLMTKVLIFENTVKLVRLKIELKLELELVLAKLHYLLSRDHGSISKAISNCQEYFV